ncbi:MAG: MerR family transcriptional regulator [Chloroflexota bacterium]|nr:MerR family transcriptional regulator [Chloroflexota bacterium]
MAQRIHATDTYRVQDFAQLAGVTVRALHHYDAAGLLTPTRSTPRDNPFSAIKPREYRRADLLRLQQILTLKRMGFSLRQIKAVLDDPAYDAARSMRIQKAALEAEIARLQVAVYALGRTVEALDTGRDIDWTQIAAIIRGLSDPDAAAWRDRYTTPEQRAWLGERAAHVSPTLIWESAKAWEAVYADFAALRHLPPNDPAVQDVAARMHTLIALFTENKPEIEASLAAAYRDGDTPATYRMTDDPSLEDSVRQAYDQFRKDMARHDQNDE